jgi:hypothetical protein
MHNEQYRPQIAGGLFLVNGKRLFSVFRLPVFVENGKFLVPLRENNTTIFKNEKGVWKMVNGCS